MAKKFTLPISLPESTLLKSWISNTQDKLQNVREVAFLKYAALKPELTDKELAATLNCQINWQEFDYKPNVKITKNCDSIFFFGDLYSAMEIDQIKNFMNDDKKAQILDLLTETAFNSSSVLYFPEGTITAQTIKLETLIVDNTIELLIIFVESNCKIIIEDFQKVVSKSIFIRSCYLIVKESSEVTLIKNKDFENISQIFSSMNCFLSYRASLKILEVLTGPKVNIESINFHLSGEHAEVDYMGLSALKNDEHVGLITTQNHTALNCKSNINIKTVLQERSRFFYRGTINIDEEALHSIADQQQKALMLGHDAQNCAIPSLEVKTNLVQCRHGSATGKINEDQLWYLQSRGLTAESAKKIIIDGFFANCSLLEYNSLKFDNILKRLKLQILL